MTFKITIKGDVVDDQTAFLYDFFQMPSVSPSAVSKQLEAAQGDDIELHIASNGGDVFAASEIFTMLRDYAGPVNATVEGLAASAASVITMGADKVSMAPTAMLMIHRASETADGNTDDLAHEANVLDKVDQAIVTAYELKTGMAEDKLLDLMTQETWLTAKDAVAQGFADEVLYLDDKQPAFADAVTHIPTKQAVNKLMNLISAAKDNKVPTSQPEPNESAVAKDALIKDKLAILLNNEKEN